MSNAFDIKKAKAWEPIEYRAPLGEGFWEPAHFIGLTPEGEPVIQYGKLSPAVFKVSIGSLRMAPKKVKVRYRVALMRRKDSVMTFYTLTADTAWGESDLEKEPEFVKWLTGWQEAEVEQ